MPKYTLLELTQSILSDMNSDEVNSITDTIESLQVAQIVKDTYYEIITEGDWPHLKTLMQLSASGDNAKPTHMGIPENVQRIETIRYNRKSSTDTNDEYEEVEYLDPEDFLSHVMKRLSSESTVETITDYSGVVILVLNDTPPTYWTSFDNENIVFDSYDSGVDTTLQASKSQCIAYREPTFTTSDSFVPDLPSIAFPYLLSEAKSAAFLALKNTANQKEEQRATRQRRRISQERWRVGGGITFPDYGRKR